LPAIKFNQKKLNGIDTVLKAVKLTEIIAECVSRFGLVTLANELDIDKSALSRFKNGEGALCLADIEKLLEYCDVTIIQRQRYRRLMYTIITLSEFLKESLGW
jgi:hypothetical protein